VIPDLDLSTIPDAGSRQAIQALLQRVETLRAENRTLRAEVQRLRDEISRLKGEQGTPTIPPKRRKDPPPAPTDHSSEAERHIPTPHQKGRKVPMIVINRTEPCGVDPAILPPDAELKGHETVIVQDLRLQIDNVAFVKEKWYAPSTGQTYLAPLPAGYDGTFGPNINALALVLHYATNVSQPLILVLFQQAGTQISAGTLAAWLIHDQAVFHAEKDAIVEAGLASSPWQQIDDTATRVNGHNQVCQVLGNPLYTAYRTAKSKTRLAVLDTLRNGRPRTFRLNDDALVYLDALGLARATRQRLLLALPWDQEQDESTLTARLATHLPTLGDGARKWIMDALAVAAYHAQVGFPVIRLLLCDDAPQFHLLVDDLALCWVHEGRHYKKLTPCVPAHQRALARFQTRFWAFYRGLLIYRARPDPAAKGRLIRGFDRLFATVTGYAALDERIANTRSKQACLLLVLDHPEIPLHNNAMELGARRRVRKRDVSFGPRTDAGARAWDTFQTIIATAQKLGVNAFHYIRDRRSGAPQLPALADLITERAATLSLGASWSRA
jgi:Transposase IS66 family